MQSKNKKIVKENIKKEEKDFFFQITVLMIIVQESGIKFDIVSHWSLDTDSTEK